MHCVVPGCNSNAVNAKAAGEEVEKRLNFHEFPKDMTLRAAWLKNIGLANWSPTDNSRICSKHFHTTSVMKGRKVGWLLPNAIPQIFLPKPTIKVEDNEIGDTTETSDNMIHIQNHGQSPQTSIRPMNDKERIMKLEQRLARAIKVSKSRFTRNNTLQKQIMRLEKKNVELYHILLTRLKPYCPIVESEKDLDSD